MAVHITEYLDVRKRCAELGRDAPTHISLLPRNFDTARSVGELFHESSVNKVRSLWKQAGIIETPIERSTDEIWCVSEKDADWIAPTIFVGASFLSQNPHLISVALNVISNYLTDLFKRGFASREAHVSIVVERIKDDKLEYYRVEYNGEPAGISDLAKVIQEVSQSGNKKR